LLDPDHVFAGISKSLILGLRGGQRDGRLFGGFPGDEMGVPEHKESSVGSASIGAVGPIGINTGLEIV
jgi:hypothetical protein